MTKDGGYLITTHFFVHLVLRAINIRQPQRDAASRLALANTNWALLATSGFPSTTIVPEEDTRPFIFPTSNESNNR